MDLGQRARRAVLLGGAGVEGGLDGPSDPTSTWREATALARVEPTGVGLGFLEEPESLLDAAVSLGIDEVLLRLEWARICPRRGVVADEALDTYAAIIAALRSRGVAVGVVLSDGTTPEWMGAEAWLMPATPKHFASYAGVVTDRLGEMIETLITLEEPGAWALAGWMVAAAPPFRIGGLRDAIACLDAMAAAHERAARTLVATRPGVEVGVLASTGWIAALEEEFFDPERSSDRRIRAMARRWGTGQAARQRLDVPPGLDGFLMPTTGQIQVPRGPTGVVPATGLLRSARRSAAAARSTQVRFSAVVAQIDSRGRSTSIRSRQRLDALGALVGPQRAQNGASIGADRVIVGDVVDRWRWGSYSGREGIFGVDRTRGRRGFRVLTTDATGVDVADPLRAMLASANP